MPEPPNSKTAPLPGNDPGSTAGHQDTVLLSDLPEPTTPAPAAAASGVHLSPAILAALAQRYDILSEAGSGSMGNVYKARDRETGETVALKLLKPDIASDQAMMDRFKNELLFARKITHKNVCRVYEFNRLDGIVCTSMEFVEGESLRAVLRRAAGRPLRKGMDWVLQICSGLKEAHAQGIVHRDLKPENIMIDAQGNVKIMDFGIARSMEAVTQHTSSMVGTPAYMSPEQVTGKPVDYRTDVYALGLIMYEVFTGKPAFQADNPVALAFKQVRETPPDPHDLEPSISMPLENTILQCLEKTPAQRFQSVAQLEEALRPSPAAPAAPPVAPPVSTAAPRPASRPEPTPPARPVAAQPSGLSGNALSGRKTDPFKPQQPVIPGVAPSKPVAAAEAPVAPQASGGEQSPASRFPIKQIALGVVAAIIVVAIILWNHGSSSTSQQPGVEVAETANSSAGAGSQVSRSVPVAPGPIARVDELTNAWSSKRFAFHDPVTSESVPAMLVRLPRGEYWA
ncbi:MAG: serine/threonine protein kinase, partial [Acidobacteriia bacterium]|nr:serine/threonine protein kinase [Terriglobia bacterium]